MLGYAIMHIIENLSKHDLVRGLSNQKYDKDHACGAYMRGKLVRVSFSP